MNRLNRFFGGSSTPRTGGVTATATSGGDPSRLEGAGPDHGSDSSRGQDVRVGHARSPLPPGAVSLTTRRGTLDKVSRLVFHPVHSYVLYSDRGGKVEVWDYESNTVVYRNQYGGVDEGGMSELVLRRRAERYSAAINSVGVEGEGGKDAVVDVKKGERKWMQGDGRYQGMSLASGKVVDVGFVDWHTCVWGLERFGVGGEDGDGVGDASPASSRHSSCWVVVASENKVTMHDLASSRGVDFVRGACFEGAKPTTVACLVRTGAGLRGGVNGRQSQGQGQGVHQHQHQHQHQAVVGLSPVLAVGTSTGAIYLIDVESGEVVGKCAGGHGQGKAVTCLEVVGSARRGGPDRLVSGSVDGTIAVWDPSRSAKGVDAKGGVCIQPITCFKAHEGGVHDVQLFGMQEMRREGEGGGGTGRDSTSSLYSTSSTSLRLQPYLASVGADKQLCTWSVVTWNRAYMPIQALPESSLVSIGATARAGLGLGSNAPLVGVSDKSCALFALDPSVGGVAGRGVSASPVRMLVDMEGWLEKGDKKRPKIYAMAVNPSKPYVYGLATNTGLVIVRDAGGAGVPSSTSLLSQQVFASAFVEMELNKKDRDEQGAGGEGNQKEREKEKDRKDGKDDGDDREQAPIKIPQGITSINVVDDNLVATLYEMKIDKSDESGRSGRRERTMHLENIGSLLIAGGTGAHSDIFANVGGDATIETSVSGRYMSVVWPRSNRYVVFAHGEPDDYGRRWRFIDGGEGRQLVWSSTAPIYAVLSGGGDASGGIGNERVAGISGMATAAPAAQRQAPLDEEQTMSPGFSMTYDGLGNKKLANTNAAMAAPQQDVMDDEAPPAYDEVVAERPTTAAATTATADASLSSPTVRVHAIQETEDGSDPTYMGYSDIALDSDARAVKIHGGSLLGVSSSAPSAEVSVNTLRFFSWVDASAIGSNLPAPNWISWDPESTMCALGYDTAIQLCAVYPHFHCFATLGIHESESAFWQIRQLYVSTPTSINVVYVDSRQSFVEEICLADFTGQSSSIRGSLTDPALAAKKHGEDRNFVFGQRRLRPAGPVRLVGIKHSYLVVHDSLERPFLISLRNHGLRARSLAAKGDIDTAVALTAKYVRPVLHYGTAQCILAMGVESDYEKVLTLPGLSPEMRISIAIRHGDWNRAARAFQAHSLGVNDAVYSSLINEEVALFSPSGGVHSLQTASQRDVIGERNMATVTNILEEAARFGGGAASDGGSSNDSRDVDDSDDSDESNDSDNSSNSDDSSSDSDKFVDPIDWSSWESTDAKGKSATASSSLSMPIVDHAELLRVFESTDLGLELASSALSSHRESSKQILGTLLAYASTLSKDRLEQLVDQMAMANMTESLRNLWSETVSAAKGTKGASQSISVAALLAASVGGVQDANMVESLREAGLYPLAFLYASVWGGTGGVESEAASLQAWREALQ